jgi:hypothetical protein
VSAPEAADDRARAVEEFIRDFFGPGNPAWPDKEPNSLVGRRLLPYLQVLHEGSDVPVVLPRQDLVTRNWAAYVIPTDRRHAAEIAELLTAFVGPSHARFHGVPAHLDPSDPVDAAVLRFAGHDAIFVLNSPRESERRAWKALQQLQQAMRCRPRRVWHAPKAVGRLLSEFDVALAAGDNSASAVALEQLRSTGGLSALNLANLRIKRLARLGCNSELLRLPEVPDVVTTRPPVPIRDALLTALFSTVLQEPLGSNDLETARAALIESGTFVPALLDGGLTGLSPEALTVLALAAHVIDTAPVARALRDNPDHITAVGLLAPSLAAHYRQPPDTDAVEGPNAATGGLPLEATSPLPASWLELVQDVATSRDVGEVLAEETWRDWAAVAVDDRDVAAVLEQINDDAADGVWSLVGPFVNADRYGQPAAHTAREFLLNALTHDRFSPGDLAGIVALTEIVLRSAPNRIDYVRLLDDLCAEATRWAGPDRAPVVLDLVDLTARSACPDTEARLRFVLLMLQPLRDHQARLEPDQAAFAAELSRELGAAMAWDAAGGSDASPVADHPSPREVLLYSLDEGVLERVTASLRTIAPHARVSTSHDQVGSPQLRQHVRRADVIVMATRCATHAATGFIRAHCMEDTIVAEADGSGSASLLRAVTHALTRVSIV